MKPNRFIQSMFTTTDALVPGLTETLVTDYEATIASCTQRFLNSDAAYFQAIRFV